MHKISRSDFYRPNGVDHRSMVHREVKALLERQKISQKKAWHILRFVEQHLQTHGHYPEMESLRPVFPYLDGILPKPMKRKPRF